MNVRINIYYICNVLYVVSMVFVRMVITVFVINKYFDLEIWVYKGIDIINFYGVF